MGPKGAVASSAVLVLLAAQVRAQPLAQPQERIEVTGTQIKRTDTETVAPVDIITREQIERSGRATVAEVLRSIPANTGGSFNESFSTGFAAGAAGISLRGLGQRATLVLVNGRRSVTYGFAQNIQDAFVDLNAIPASAVDRIEVLKDGASAIYGSDAIAGVVNIILRREFHGIELGVQVGHYEGKGDQRFTATGGFGDLRADRYAAWSTLEYYRRDLLTLADTRFGASADMRSHQGGRNAQSLTGGGTWRQLSPSGTPSSVHRAIAECPGAVLSGPEAVELGLIAPLLSSATFNVPGNTFCAYDFNGQFTALPKTERMAAFGRLNLGLSSTTTAFADVGLSRVSTFQSFQAPFFAGASVADRASGELRRSVFNVNFAPGVAGNPFDANASYLGMLNGLGTRDGEITSDTTSIVVGADYTVGRWEVDSAAGWARNSVDQIRFNQVIRPGIAAALGVTTAIQPPIPLSIASMYNLDQPSLNSEAVRSQVVRTFRGRDSVSELRYIDSRAATEVGWLSGGAVGLAIGAELRRESLKDDSIVPPDILAFSGSTSTDGARTTFASFAEMALPVAQNIELQLAGRYDHYSDFGGEFTPKVGVKLKPHDSLLLRTTWGRGFRAPSLVQIAPSETTVGSTVQDPATQRFVNVGAIFSGNPGLKPENSTTLSFGGVVEPIPGLGIGINAYRLTWRNMVRGDCCQAVVNAADPARVIRDPQTGAIILVVGRWENVARTETQGIDLDMQYRRHSPWGRWVARADLSYVGSWKEDGTDFAGTNGHGQSSIPRVRAHASLEWDWANLSATVGYNFVRGMKQRLLPETWFQEHDPRFQNGAFPRRMRDYHTWDAHVSWQANREFKVSAAVINAFDEKPPLDPGYGFYDFGSYDIRGTQYRLGLTWRM